MSKDKPKSGPWDSGWWTAEMKAAASARWTPEMRAKMSAQRKAHRGGSRTKEWWATHPEAKAAAAQRLAKARAARKATGA